MKFITNRVTNISALQFIQLLRFSILLLISVVFARFYSKSQIGEYETLLFVASAVSFFWLRGILQTFLSLLDSQAGEKKSDIYFNVFVLLLLFSALIVVFLFVFKGSIEKYLTNSQSIPYFKWLILYLFFSTPAYLIEYMYVALNKPKPIFMYGLVSYGLQFLILTVPTFLGYSIEIALIGLVVISFGRFIFLLTVLYKYAELTFSFPFIRKHLKLAYPLIGSSLLSGSGQYVDGFIIKKLFDTADFAVFRYGAREFPLVVIMANALSHAMIPEFAKLSYTEALEKLKSSSLKLMHLLFPITLALLVSSNILFPLVFTENFSLSAKIFNVYSLLIVLRLIFPETVLIGRKYTTVFLSVSLMEISVNIFLSVVFAHRWGLLGIAYATVLANLLERIVLLIVVKWKYKTAAKEYIPLNWFAFYSLVFVLAYIVVDFIIFK
jgi:O-antigen/teichoic acid export membrane protein